MHLNLAISNSFEFTFLISGIFHSIVSKTRDSYYRSSNQMVIPKGFYEAVFRRDLNLIGGLE